MTSGKEEYSAAFHPEVPTVDNFSHPLYAKIADIYWGDESYQAYSDAVLPAVRTMSPAQLIETALFIEHSWAGLESDSGRLVSIWPDIHDLNVDEHGLVHATLGKLTDVVAYFESREDVRLNLGEDIEASEMWNALVAAKGETYAQQVSELMYEEQRRREDVALAAVKTVPSASA